ncbi:MAG: YeeE/YedE thiosulfate transporter family protein [Bacteroidales bacterium]
MTWTILIMGFLFGILLQYAKLNKYNTISGMAILEDFTVAKTIATAIGIGAILISIETGLGLASYHIKPFMVEHVIFGGIIFGIGMAVLGYCPGTLPISFGQGSLDALFGILGGFLGGFIHTIISPGINQIFKTNLGKISLFSAIGSYSVLFYALVIIIGAFFVAVSFWLNKIEKKKDMKWFYTGLGIAILACFVFASSITDRVIGVSSFYSKFGNTLTGNTQNNHFTLQSISQGDWHMNFILGAFISGLVISLLRKEFKFQVVYENWARFKGSSLIRRLIWSFSGGFLLLFGAKLAKGCTSGHVISGGMQLAASSMVFAAFVFASFLLTGKIFYKKK